MKRVIPPPPPSAAPARRIPPPPPSSALPKKKQLTDHEQFRIRVWEYLTSQRRGASCDQASIALGIPYEACRAVFWDLRLGGRIAASGGTVQARGGRFEIRYVVVNGGM